WPALADGDAEVGDGEGLRTADGTLVLPSRLALGWLGPLPDPARLSSAEGRATVTGALARSRRSVLLDAPWHDKVAPALDAIGRLEPLEALKAAARALGGLGPGLTPAGDDALSGVLFAFRALGGPSVEPALLAVARSVRTGDIAAALLEAAATGAHIEPAHDLVMAAAARDASAAARAARALDEFGSTSGADLAYGLRLTLTRR
ncbi:MAG TPA: DUF2877 domain-containing protein, partial [Acidimicrobiia bacterium]|nr:DUF2877 domain-containing protein [Acidimicrobiia bacterium]